ncbi:UDP-N-acetylglucosamine-dolichyl-phosphate N-acetylglucosaminephosphotransferase [Smittium mucronatum]|uniref:UDP-N-acetylglucosamine--dolichyl-phosphate N-acetylglucosaminephosphotransferase n=1 Tax=Smittium mucronatum TaxID=133383 RepID=A0A1R0GZ83_9FUNG|nr:UDP-N-acetylglucosamine-dolichyl-phosphate N-acetylglucosaminephosphotransferase [Smittium mucronatum]
MIKPKNLLYFSALPLIYVLFKLNVEPIVLCLIISVMAGLATLNYIPQVEKRFKKVGLYGADLNKKNKPVLAEGMGVIAATFYLIATILFIPLIFNKNAGKKHILGRFPYEKFGEYLSALLSLQSMVFLGFADDVLNLRWRFKLILPTIASIPILMVYYVSFGVTHVIVPRPFRDLLGVSIDLNAFYYVYIGMMSVFCTNSINILAGINGVEVIQSIVISVCIIINNLLHILYSKNETVYYHSLSLCLMIPFLSVSLALYQWNKYPARVFVGDTYCYFAGMAFACVGILGHFSKTLLLFFLLQILNFIYSLPQLFRIVPCPRHRMPAFTKLHYTSDAQIPNTLRSIPEIGSLSSKKKHPASLFLSASDSQSSNTDSLIQHSPETSSSSSPETPRQTIKPVRKRSQSPSINSSTPPTAPPAHLPRTPVLPTGLLIPSKTPLENCSPLGLRIISLFEFLNLVRVWRDPKSNKMLYVSNFTVLNLYLVWFGPMHERDLTRLVMYSQIALSFLAFFIRYTMSSIFYEDVFK